MSLLGRGAVRSDAPESLTVPGCAVACVNDGAVNAIIHARLPAASGKRVAAIMQRLLDSSKFHADISHRGRMTVDDEGLSLHCMATADGVLLLACTAQDYPQRLVFPPAVEHSGSVGLLASIGATGAAASLPRPERQGITVFTPSTRVLQALERACADHEDARARDPVLKVKDQVDEVRSLMRDNIDSVLVNTDKLDELNSKATNLAGISQGFYGSARTTRRRMQWEDLKWKLVLGGIVLAIFLFFTWGWWFGGDDS